MPSRKDPFKTKPHSGKPSVKKSAPTTPLKGGVKAPTKGVSPGAKGGSAGGLIGQPSVTRTPHIQKVSQMRPGKAGANVSRGKGNKGSKGPRTVI